MCSLVDILMQKWAAWGPWPVHCSGSRQTAHLTITVDVSFIFALQFEPCSAQARPQVMKLLPFYFAINGWRLACALIVCQCHRHLWSIYRTAVSMPCAISQTTSQTSLSCACPLPHTMYYAALVAHYLDKFNVGNLMLGMSIAMRCSHPNVRQAALDCDNVQLSNTL